MVKSLCVAICVAFLSLVAADAVAGGTQELQLPSGALVPFTPDPQIEGQGLGRSAIFARIDSLENRYHDKRDPDRGVVAYRLGQLYLSTGLIKHKRLALEMLDTALQLQPDMFDAGVLRASTAQSMRYPSQARKWLEEMRWQFPQDPRPHQELGEFHFTEARRSLNASHFARAVRSYSDAVAIDSTDVNSTVGLIASYVALNQYDNVPYLANTLRQVHGHEQSGLMVLGSAYAALGKDDDAWTAFLTALRGEDEYTRAVFLEGSGFFDGSKALKEHAKRLDIKTLTAAMAGQERGWTPDDGFDIDLVLRDDVARQAAVASFWRSVNPRPSRVANKNLLAYWQRLVEAEVLFGDPLRGLRGWESYMGEAWVRWGRPQQMFYGPPTFGSRIDQLAQFRFRPNTLIPQGAIMVWGYDLGYESFALIFEDVSYNARWTPTGQTEWWMEYSRKQQPVFFEQQFEVDPTFRVYLSTAAFYRPQQRASLESYLALRPLASFVAATTGPVTRTVSVAGENIETTMLKMPQSGTQALFQVEWALFDASERRIDFQQRYVDSSRQASRLQHSLGQPATMSDYDPLVIQWAADLRPGRYRVAVDVTDLGSGHHESREILLDIPPRPSAELSISDLEIASTFTAYQGQENFPSDYLKHAFGVVPAPEGLFPYDAQTLYVYYEVYNLAQDERGQTRFNVSYDVYRRKDRDKDKVLTHLERDGLSRVDPLGLTYLEETTGASSQRHVVKGGMVDITDLKPGRYVLVVTVEDLTGGARKESFATFSKAAAN